MFNIPSSQTNLEKVGSSSGLVKMSAIWLADGTKSSTTVPFMTCSLIKWYLMSMCFVLECCTGLLEMAIAHVLTQNIGILFNTSP